MPVAATAYDTLSQEAYKAQTLLFSRTSCFGWAARADQEEHQQRPEYEPTYNPRTRKSVLIRSKHLMGRHTSSR
jgi:hypothetical protein